MPAHTNTASGLELQLCSAKQVALTVTACSSQLVVGSSNLSTDSDRLLLDSKLNETERSFLQQVVP